MRKLGSMLLRDEDFCFDPNINANLDFRGDTGEAMIGEGGHSGMSGVGREVSVRGVEGLTFRQASMCSGW